MMRIVVPDCLGDAVVEQCFAKHLTAFSDVSIHRDPPRDEDALGERLATAECALVHFEGARITKAVIEGSPYLRIVSIAGAGMDCVDAEAARARGIRIATTPQAAIPAVAEMTVALMLAMARSIPSLDRAVRGGEWPVLHGFDLAGKTIRHSRAWRHRPACRPHRRGLRHAGDRLEPEPHGCTRR